MDNRPSVVIPNKSVISNTAASWAAANPILPDGIQAHESDTGKYKVGDGKSAYNALPALQDDLFISDRTNLISLEDTPYDLQFYRMTGNWYERSSLAEINGGPLPKDVMVAAYVNADVLTVEFFDFLTGAKIPLGIYMSGVSFQGPPLPRMEHGECYGDFPIATYSHGIQCRNFRDPTVYHGVLQTASVAVGDIHGRREYNNATSPSLPSNATNRIVMGLSRSPAHEPVMGDPIQHMAIGFASTSVAAVIIIDDTGAKFACTGAYKGVSWGIAIEDGRLYYTALDNSSNAWIFSHDLMTAVDNFVEDGGPGMTSDSNVQLTKDLKGVLGRTTAMHSNAGLFLANLAYDRKGIVTQLSSATAIGIHGRNIKNAWGMFGESTLDGFMRQISPVGVTNLTAVGSPVVVPVGCGDGIYGLKLEAGAHFNYGGHHDSFAPGVSLDLWASVWVDKKSLADAQPIMAFENAEPGYGMWMLWSIFNKAEIYCRDGTTTVSARDSATLTDGLNKIDGVFERASQTARIYVNGRLAGSQTYTGAFGAISAGTAKFNLGAREYSTDTFEGIIVAPRIGFTAPTDAQVRQAYEWEKRIVIDGDPFTFGGQRIGYVEQDAISAWGQQGDVSLSGFITDRSGRASDLTTIGVPTAYNVLGTNVPAITDLSDGNYFQKAYDSAYDFTSDFAILMWVKLTEAGSAKTVFHRAYWNGTAYSGAALECMVDADGVPYVNHVGTLSVGGLDTEAGHKVNDGQWHLVVYQRRNRKLEVWVDDSMIGSGAHSADLTNALATASLGASVQGTGALTAGHLALPRVIGRSLSPSKIADIYTYEKRALVDGEAINLKGVVTKPGILGWIPANTMGAWGAKGAESVTEFATDSSETGTDLAANGSLTVSPLNSSGIPRLSGFSSVNFLSYAAGAPFDGLGTIVGAVWVSTSDADAYDIVYSWAASGFSGHYWQLQILNGMPRIYAVGANGIASLASATAVADAIYHHVVWEISPSGMRIYIDGILDVQSSSTPGNMTNASAGLNVGVQQGGNHPVDGTLALPRLLPRIMSPAEIKAMYEYEHRIVIDGEDLPLEGYISKSNDVAIDTSTGYIHVARDNGTNIFDGPALHKFVPRTIESMPNDGADRVILLDDYKVIQKGTDAGLIIPRINLRERVEELAIKKPLAPGTVVNSTVYHTDSDVPIVNATSPMTIASLVHRRNPAYPDAKVRIRLHSHTVAYFNNTSGSAQNIILIATVVVNGADLVADQYIVINNNIPAAGTVMIPLTHAWELNTHSQILEVELLLRNSTDQTMRWNDGLSFIVEDVAR